MLNETLWQAVLAVDPNAQCHDEDDPGEFQLPVDSPSGLFGKGVKNPDRFAHMTRWGERYSLNCQTCGDTRGRLYICHRYGTTLKTTSNNTIKFGRRALISCKNEECQINEFHRDAFWYWLDHKLVLPSRYASQAIDKDVQPGQVDPKAFNLLADIQLPWPRFPLQAEETPHAVIRYLEDRGFNICDLFSTHQVMFVPRGASYTNSAGEPKTMFDDRVLIPVWQHNRCVYWQARAIDDKVRLKYLNPGACKSALLYNMDRAMMHPSIVIFEGATNTWRFGDASVALMGKGLSPAQMAIMKVIWGYDGCGVVCLDEDVYTPDKFGIIHDTDIRRAEALIRNEVFPRGVGILRLRNGDAAKHDPKRLWQLFEMAVAKATTDIASLNDAIVDELHVHDLPPEDQQSPRVDALVSDRYAIDLEEDQDGLDGDWECADELDYAQTDD